LTPAYHEGTKEEHEGHEYFLYKSEFVIFVFLFVPS